MKITCPHCGHELTREEAKHISRVYAGSSVSEKKKAAVIANGKRGGRPKGAKNKAPRADKGVPRGPRNMVKEQEHD
jgi:hypothetical protein